MSAFHGGQGRGAARKRRELKRLEAEDRQRAHDIDVRATALMGLVVSHGAPPRGACRPFRVGHRSRSASTARAVGLFLVDYPGHEDVWDAPVSDGWPDGSPWHAAAEVVKAHLLGGAS